MPRSMALNTSSSAFSYLSPFEHRFGPILSDRSYNRQSGLVGFKLHLEDIQYAGEDMKTMTFYKGSASVVHVGRMPSGSAEGAAHDRALFKCPVVSRTHAKFIFSENGTVDILDLGSHHGTHIRRLYDTTTMMIKPNISIPLGDGDVITFGKTVGRYSETVVKPVVVRIEILDVDSLVLPPVKPLIVPNHPITAASRSPTSRSSTGRYGLASDSSPSSSDEPISPSYSPISTSNELEVDDDVQIIDKPRFDNDTGARLLSMFERLKNTRAPVHDPNTIISIDLEPEYEPEPELEEADEEEQHQSRFTSPMELASPESDAMELESPDSMAGDELHANPWRQFSEDSDAQPCSLTLISPSEVLSIEGHSATSGECHAQQIVYTPIVDEQVVSEEHPQVESFSALSPAPAPVTAAEPSTTLLSHIDRFESLDKSVAGLKADTNRLNIKRLNYRTCFNANVRRTTKKLGSMDSRITEIKALCSSLEERVSDLKAKDHEAQIDQLEGQVATLQDCIAANAMMEVIPELLAERVDVQESISTLNKLVQEMEVLKGNMQDKLDAELQAVKSVSSEVITAIREHHRSFISTTPLSLKRKRSDEDEDESEAPSRDDDVMRDRGTQMEVEDGTSTDIPTLVARIPRDRTVPTTTATVVDERGILVPRRKRARRVGFVLAQTAASMTVGAIAAWSALAFL